MFWMYYKVHSTIVSHVPASTGIKISPSFGHFMARQHDKPLWQEYTRHVCQSGIRYTATPHSSWVLCRIKMLTKNATSSECSLHWFIRLVLLIAAYDTVLHVVVFQHKAKHFELMPTSTASVAELRLTPTARHVVTALRSLDVNLNNKYHKHYNALNCHASI